jgi:hypothetical protein
VADTAANLNMNSLRRVFDDMALSGACSEDAWRTGSTQSDAAARA